LEKDKAYAKHSAAAVRQVAALTTALERKRVGVEVAAHRMQIEARATALKEKLDALGQEVQGLDEAEQAVKELEGAIDGDSAVAEKDKKYAAYLSDLKKKLPGHLAAIDRKRNQQ